VRAVRRLLLVTAAALLWAAPAQAFTKQTGTRTMSDGVGIAYDLYEPDGAAPAGGWPGVIVMHGLGGSKDDMATIAQTFVSHDYAVLAYTDRGHGTSGGDAGLAGPDDMATEQAMFSFFTGLPEVSDTQIGAWGISYGGGQAWDGMTAGIRYKAAEVVETWTDLYTALLPQDVAKSGIVLGFAKAIEARSPLIASIEGDAIHSTNTAALKVFAASRSSYAKLPTISTPVYMFQGRVDYAFDVGQALNGYTRVTGPKHLYVGQFGHAPSTFPGPDVSYVLSQGVAWYDHWLKNAPNGIDKAPPVTFGVSLLKVQVQSVKNYPRLVATVLAGSRVVSHGGIVPKRGLNTIRLANYVQYLPKGTKLTVAFGESSKNDVAYLGFASTGTIKLGAAVLSLQILTKPVSG
jgi:ABC-2 type transport system ATP-binding protein